MKPYYEVLGLKEGASLEEVTASYLSLRKNIISAVERGQKLDRTIPQINEAYVKLKESKVPLAVDFDLEEHLRKSFTSVRAERRKARKRKVILASGMVAVLLLVGGSLLVLERSKKTLPPESTSAEDRKIRVKGSLEKARSFSSAETKPPEKMAKAAPQEPSKLAPPQSRELLPFKSSSREATAVSTPKAVELKATEKPPLPAKAPSAVSSPKAEDWKAKETPPVPTPLKPVPPVEVARAVPQEPSPPPLAETSKPAAEAAARVEPPKPIPQEPVPIPMKEPEELKAKAEPPIPILPPPKAAPAAEVAKASPVEETKIAKPESAGAPEPAREKEEKVASVSPSAIASEQEVRNFFENYLFKYNRKEVSGFMSLFSARAIQNQKDDVERIRKTYENFFAQMESVNYKIAITGIEPKRDQVEVKARYELEGIVAKGRKMQNWKGQIRWVLVREGGALKIISLDYQPQGSK
ncbi:MAG: hypothetical protein HXY45_07820 [Syntrophaceae bacterium]|nr:hypothetical protein [Syntrophaceae bacterium]